MNSIILLLVHDREFNFKAFELTVLLCYNHNICVWCSHRKERPCTIFWWQTKPCEFAKSLYVIFLYANVSCYKNCNIVPLHLRLESLKTYFFRLCTWWMTFPCGTRQIHYPVCSTLPLMELPPGITLQTGFLRMRDS